MADVKVRIIAVDEASEPLKKTGEEVEKVGKKAKEAGGAFEGLGKTMVSIAGGLGLQMGLQAIVGGLKNAVVGSFELAAALEQTKVGFTTMLGSGEAAQGMLDELRDFAATTPFQFQDLTVAASRMIAMGTAAEDVIPTLTAVGDAAAGLGLGKAGIDRITLALSQMGAKGKIGGDDLRQLAEAGIPALKYLADAAGVTTAEMQKMIEKGIIPAEEGVKVLVQSMSGDFGGLMAEQAKTATGALSNLEDATATLGTQIGERLVPAVTGASGALAKFFGALASGQTAMDQDRDLTERLLQARLDHKISVEELNSALRATPFEISSKGLILLANTVKDVDVATALLAKVEADATFEMDRAADSTNENYTAVDKLVPKVDEAKDAILQLKEALALQAGSATLVSGALKDFDKDTEKLAETTAKHQKVVDDLTAAHGKNQAAILAGTGTIKDNSEAIDKSALLHRDLKQDVQQLNEKQAEGKISGEDYTLAMDHLNIKIREQNEEHGKLVATQGTGLTATQLAGVETANYTIKLGEATAALEADKAADILLQTQVATRIKEGIVLEQIASDAKDGLSALEITRIQSEAAALGISNSTAITDTLLVQGAATALADARKVYASAFASENEAGIASFASFVNSISGDVTNRIQPDLKKAQDAARDTAKEFREIATEYNSVQSKDVQLRITTIRQTIEQSVAGGLTVAAAVAKVSGGGTAGQKASGGAVMGGAGSYLVGELGPELFNPAGTGGTIVPNNRLTGGGGLAIGTLNVYGVQSTSELFNQLSKEARARGMQFAVN